MRVDETKMGRWEECSIALLATDGRATFTIVAVVLMPRLFAGVLLPKWCLGGL